MRVRGQASDEDMVSIFTDAVETGDSVEIDDVSRFGEPELH